MPPWGWALIGLLVILAAIAGGGMPGTSGSNEIRIEHNQTHNNNYGCGDTGIRPRPDGTCP